MEQDLRGELVGVKPRREERTGNNAGEIGRGGAEAIV